MDGIVYSCTGELFVAEALASARTSLRHNPLPHLVFASPPPEAEIDQDGLSIVPFETSGNPYADKIANMIRSPFERTIYLDSDTYVVDEIAHVLELMERYDIAAAFAPGYRGLADPDVPIAFYEFNTGVVAWRAGERATAFLTTWRDTYLAWTRDPAFPGAGPQKGRADQPAFRRCAWETDARIAVLGNEYNYRTFLPGAVAGRVRVIHARRDDYEQVAAKLNAGSGARAFPGV